MWAAGGAANVSSAGLLTALRRYGVGQAAAGQVATCSDDDEDSGASEQDGDDAHAASDAKG